MFLYVVLLNATFQRERKSLTGKQGIAVSMEAAAGTIAATASRQMCSNLDRLQRTPSNRTVGSNLIQ